MFTGNVDLAKLEEILGETYGIIVYQEQVMRIAVEIAGFSLAKADTLRKAMGKKKQEIIDREGVGTVTAVFDATTDPLKKKGKTGEPDEPEYGADAESVATTAVTLEEIVTFIEAIVVPQPSTTPPTPDGVGV